MCLMFLLTAFWDIIFTAPLLNEHSLYIKCISIVQNGINNLNIFIRLKSSTNTIYIVAFTRVY